MASKYETKFVKHKARVEQICSVCGRSIEIGEYYSNEETVDPFLNGQLTRRRKLCESCYKNTETK